MRPNEQPPPPPCVSNCNGKPETQRQFVLSALDRYERPLTAYAMRLTDGDLHSARDAVQHAFMQLCKQPIESVKPKLAPWLYTVCRNQILDEFKSNFHRKSSPATFDTIDQKAIDPASLSEIDELSQTLKGLFSCLHESEREVIELWSHGFDTAEIGNILDKKPGTVRVNLHRAIKRLRQHPQVTKWLDRAPSQSVEPSVGPDVERIPGRPIYGRPGVRSATSTCNEKIEPTISGEQT